MGKFLLLVFRKSFYICKIRQDETGNRKEDDHNRSWLIFLLPQGHTKCERIEAHYHNNPPYQIDHFNPSLPQA
jgi:hypothetical protein